MGIAHVPAIAGRMREVRTVLTKFQLTNQVAVVTGGGRGLGRAIALSLAEAGADVCIGARTVAEIEETAAQAKAFGRRAIALPTDVCSTNHIDNMVKDTLDQFGRIDILVNNAGGGMPSPLVEASEELWEQTLRLNLTSVFLCCRAVGQVMIKQNQGTIINISSGASFAPSPNVGLYSTAKAGLNQLTKVLAVELAPHNIRVNAVAPGGMEAGPAVAYFKARPDLKEERIKDTPMHRFGEPEEVGNAVVFLASEAASYITGAILKVTGGISLYG